MKIRSVRKRITKIIVTKYALLNGCLLNILLIPCREKQSSVRYVCTLLLRGGVEKCVNQRRYLVGCVLYVFRWILRKRRPAILIMKSGV